MHRFLLVLLAAPGLTLALTTAPGSTIRASTSLPTVRRTALVGASHEDPALQTNGVRKGTKADLTAAVSPLAVVAGFSPQIMMAALMFASLAVPGIAQAADGAGAAAAAAPTFGEIMAKASKKAMGGGLAGSIAGVVQVCTLMWMRTTMNYQYRYGGSTGNALKTLWAEGGIGRFYQGLPYAIMQTPLARFGDTAANTGVLTVFAIAYPHVPLAIQTAIASAAGSLWRILITPVDTLKTTLQVEGAKGMAQLGDKIKANSVMVLYEGAIANAVASFVGSYPWYFTFNWLQKVLPMAPEGALALKLLRNAAAGFGATCVSDCVSNVIRVLKTTVQTSPTKITYQEAAKQIIDKDGVFGLLTRGLGTRLLTNGIQASTFSVLWKILEEQFTK